MNKARHRGSWFDLAYYTYIFSSHITLYSNVSSTLLRKNRNTDFLYIYIYILCILKIKDFMNLEYFVKKGNCLFDFRRIRRTRRYKTLHFGSIVVEKDKILYLRSSFKVISRKIFQKCWCRDACFTMYYDINVCVGPSVRLIWGGNLNIVHCRKK